MQTKMLKDNTEEFKPNNNAESAKWMKSIIEDEHNKPLEV